ncbi:hypothetical protein [Salirhabdus sp. Marseille-P4669]|uniref:hypothetical protein n=1 Tax=Salirhabdus sp. Marseille-P4669 TaxID=2042310 RepID=UPI00135A19F7|nr:hypothetical protein [Salirhabdus sp. Marseille-P4669]
MRRLYYRVKYYWHSTKFKQLKMVIPDCICDKTRDELQHKMEYHEKAALRYIMKSSK